MYFYLVDGNIIGRGEAAPSNRYNESIDKIISILQKGISLPEEYIKKNGIPYKKEKE